MIPFDFEYYRPASIPEAVQLFQYLSVQGKQPVYYSGGTEIITMARLHQMVTNAVIDMKGIPECNALYYHNHQLVIGAAITLTQLAESNVFPLLGKTGSGAADHTARGKITLGGNICGKIIYKEAVLPLLLSDSQAVIAGPKGLKSIVINQVFSKTLQLEQGELLVQLITDRSYIDLPYVSVKKRKIGKVGYPLVTIAALKKDQRIRTAFSGVCAFPFRSAKIEEDLNNPHLPLDLRINEAIQHLPAPLMHDTEGSAEYREFVLRNTLLDTLIQLGG